MLDAYGIYAGRGLYRVIPAIAYDRSGVAFYDKQGILWSYSNPDPHGIGDILTNKVLKYRNRALKFHIMSSMTFSRTGYVVFLWLVGVVRYF